MFIDKGKVRRLMQQQGYKTQTELAEALGVTRHQLSVMLSKRFNPVKRNVVKLCEALEVSPLEIINDPQLTIYDLRSSNKDSGTLERENEYRVLELFAGAGGLALGLEQAGLKAEALVEIDEDCCKTLRLNRPTWNIIHKDIREVDFTRFKHRIHVITGGFPCQAFSYAGKKLGFEDTRGTLFYEFARAVREIRPLLFMAENVRGLLSHDRGRTIDTMYNVLTSLGYTVRHKLLNAVHYCVPQKRQRVIIVGTLPGVSFEFPRPSSKKKVLRDALKNVPPSEGVQYSERKRKVLELVPPGGCWRDLPLDIQKSYMGKSFYSSGGRTGMARRLSWDEPCLTLTCSPSQKQTERCHPEETRPFTVREYARIQTFPDNWDFTGPVYSKYRQIGNAVPVEMARRLGVQIVKALDTYYQQQKEEQLVGDD